MFEPQAAAVGNRAAVEVVVVGTVVGTAVDEAVAMDVTDVVDTAVVVVVVTAAVARITHNTCLTRFESDTLAVQPSPSSVPPLVPGQQRCQAWTGVLLRLTVYVQLILRA